MLKSVYIQGVGKMCILPVSSARSQASEIRVFLGVSAPLTMNRNCLLNSFQFHYDAKYIFFWRLQSSGM